MYNVNKKAMNDIEALPNLGFAALALGNEGMGNIFKRLSDTFAGRLKGVTDYFNTKKGEVKEINITAKELNGNYKLVSNITKNAKYSKIVDIRVGAVLGLRTNLHEAINELAVAISIINTELYTELDQLDTILSKFITDKDYRTTLTTEDINYTHSSQDLKDSLDRIIDPNSLKDLFTVGELLPNVNSLSYTYDTLIKTNQTINEKDLNKLQDKIGNIYEKSNTLISMIKKKDIEVVSKVVIERLADKIIDNAKFVTLSVSTYHLLNMFNTHTNRMIEIIDQNI